MGSNLRFRSSSVDLLYQEYLLEILRLLSSSLPNDWYAVNCIHIDYLYYWVMLINMVIRARVVFLTSCLDCTCPTPPQRRVCLKQVFKIDKAFCV